MLPKIGDELVVKIREGKIISTYAVTFDDKQTVQVIYANHVSSEYLCYVPPYNASVIKESFRITEPVLRTYKLKKSYLNYDAVIVRKDCVDRLIEGPDGLICNKCDTFVQYAMGQNFVCYSCRENPYPSWRNIPNPDND